MRIYHRTGADEADLIIRGHIVRASAADTSSYDVNSGPFFFVKGFPEVERATGPNSHQVVLEFDCHLPAIRRDRSAQHMRDINAGRTGELLGKLILEYNPFLHGEMMQARIIPEAECCLTFTGFDAPEIRWLTRRRWTRVSVQRPLFSIGFRT